jgi:hypothetical protein
MAVDVVGATEHVIQLGSEMLWLAHRNTFTAHIG